MEPKLENLSGELAVKKIRQENIAEAKKKEDSRPYVRIKIRPEDIGKLAELALGNGKKYLPTHIDFQNEGADEIIFCSAIIEIEA